MFVINGAGTYPLLVDVLDFGRVRSCWVLKLMPYAMLPL